MKQISFFIFCSILFIATQAQNNYTEALQEGDNAFKNGQYKIAINKYFAAEAFDPTKKDEVKTKVNKVFDRIESLRMEAEKARKETEKAKTEADAAKNKAILSAAKTQAALDKAKTFFESFYFYKNRFALAYKSTGFNRAEIMMFTFYFIDQDGQEVEKLGRWDQAGPFEKSGFAKVKKDEGEDELTNYILDTSGNIYKAAFDIRKMDSSIVAYDQPITVSDIFPKEIPEHRQLRVLLFNGSYYNRYIIFEIPEKIFQLTNLENLQLSNCFIDTLTQNIGRLVQLRILNLAYNKIRSVPGEIGELKNLELLDLSNNSLTGLPAPMEMLKNLKTLDLTGNNIPEKEIEILKMKLPKCKIIK